MVDQFSSVKYIYNHYEKFLLIDDGKEEPINPT